jgi:sugar lactone lactonase YvrE
MSTDLDFDRIARAWLADGPTELSNRVLDTVDANVHRIRQRRAMRAPWRLQPMTNQIRLAIAAALVVVVGAAGLLYFNGQNAPSIGGPTPSASPAASASAAPTTTATASAIPSPSLGVKADGTIVFGLPDPAAKATTDIFAVAPDGTGLRKLVTQDSCCVSLSPDGRSIVYATIGSPVLTPRVINLDGTGPSSFTSQGGLNLGPAGWSSRNDIAFEGWDDHDPSKTGLYLSIDNGGGLIWGTLKRLTSRPGRLHDIPLAFSHDGSKLLFLRVRIDGHTGVPGPYGDLYVIGVDGSGLRRLNPVATGVYTSDSFGPGASWSPDDRQVAFSAFDDATTNGSSAIYVVDAAAGTAKAISESISWATSARWSPDGTWIAFDHVGLNAGHDLFLIHPDGTGLTKLSKPAGLGVCCAQWSPDSSELLVQGGVVPNALLYIVHADGSGTVPLTTDLGSYTWYSWGQLPKGTP